MKETIFITSPLEAANVERLRNLAPERFHVVYETELMPPVRYIADHQGAPFTRTPEQEQRWREGLATADILWDFPASMDLAPRVKWIQTTSTGVGQMVKRLGLIDTGVLITTARGVHGGPLSEFVMLGLLAHFRGLRHLEAEQRAHRWVRYCGDEMAGKTVVFIGAGDLARASAALAKAFGMKTVALARHAEKDRAHNDLFDEIHAIADLHTVLSRADAVVVTTPHTAETENLIDTAAFAAMPRGAALVNIARGVVLDEQALIANLRSGHLGFAALDVATVEPLAEDSPLWDMPNVLISPHSASTVYSENQRITDIFCHNLRCWMDDRVDRMRNVFNKDLLY